MELVLFSVCAGALCFSGSAGGFFFPAIRTVVFLVNVNRPLKLATCSSNSCCTFMCPKPAACPYKGHLLSGTDHRGRFPEGPATGGSGAERAGPFSVASPVIIWTSDMGLLSLFHGLGTSFVASLFVVWMLSSWSEAARSSFATAAVALVQAGTKSGKQPECDDELRGNLESDPSRRLAIGVKLVGEGRRARDHKIPLLPLKESDNDFHPSNSACCLSETEDCCKIVAALAVILIHTAFRIAGQLSGGPAAPDPPRPGWASRREVSFDCLRVGMSGMSCVHTQRVHYPFLEVVAVLLSCGPNWGRKL